eukprot:m51a1_g12913 putative polyketide synthase (106) ;mRNA; f:2798-3189
MSAVAIIGIGCRLPGGHDDAASFHQALLGGLDAMRAPVPGTRWDAASLDDPSRRMGTIDHLEDFDARFFGISDVEADRMDPHQRLALETTVHAFQDAGLKLSRGL